MGSVSMELCPKGGDLNLAWEMYINRELCLEHCDLKNHIKELRIRVSFRDTKWPCARHLADCLAYLTPLINGDCLREYLGQWHAPAGSKYSDFHCPSFQRQPAPSINHLAVCLFWEGKHWFRGKYCLVVRLEQYLCCISFWRSCHFSFWIPWNKDAHDTFIVEFGPGRIWFPHPSHSNPCIALLPSLDEEDYIKHSAFPFWSKLPGSSKSHCMLH